jgi:putative spermidine/putrescine transport system substrate-binding protein
VELGRANNAGLLASADGNVKESELFPGALVVNGVASHSFGNLIVYRTDAYPNGGPKNWAEFWDEKKFPGERCLQRYAGRVIGMALMADGVDPKDLFPYDLDRAFKSLDRIKKRVSVWWNQGPQSTQIIRDNQVPAIGMWAAFAQTAINDGAPVALEWNQALVDTAYWVVAKGTPRSDIAWEFVKFAVQAERVARFAFESGTGPTNPKGFDFLTADEAKLAVTAPANRDKVVFFNVEKLMPQIDELQRRFDEWIAT